MSSAVRIRISLLWAWMALCVSASPTSLESLERRAPGSSCKLANTGANLGVGFPYGCYGTTLSTTGTVRAFVFFIDFPDAHATETASTEYASLITSSPGLASWFNTASYGKLTLSVSGDTSKYYRLAANSNTFNYGGSGGTSWTAAQHQAFIQAAIQAYIASKGSIPKFDILYVVSTKNAPSIAQCAAYMGGSVFAPNGTAVAKRSVTCGHWYDDWPQISKVSVHEFGHTFCLPDLYPLWPETGTATRFVGGFDLMGLISAQSSDFFGWNKWYLGWITDSQVRCISSETGTFTYTLSPVETTGATQIKLVVYRRPGSSTEVLVAELRSTSGVDSGACSTGVLLYKVDVSKATGQGAIRVVDALPTSAGCDGDPLTNAPLKTTGPTSFVFSEWGSSVTVQVTGMSGSDYNVKFIV